MYHLYVWSQLSHDEMTDLPCLIGVDVRGFSVVECWFVGEGGGVAVTVALCWSRDDSSKSTTFTRSYAHLIQRGNFHTVSFIIIHEASMVT